MGMSRLTGLAVLAGGSLLALPAALSAQSRTETHTYDALGRLVVTRTNGGPAQADTRSLCYDEEGNRQKLAMVNDGTVAACAPPPVQTPPPVTGTPTPTPPPSGNTPPVAVNDAVSGKCFHTATINLTANDSDAQDSPAKPVLVSVDGGSGGFAGAYQVSNSSVSVDFGPAGDWTQFTYTVRDSAGATATGTLTVTTSGSCDGFVQY